jgi:hypothetical protein
MTSRRPITEERARFIEQRRETDAVRRKARIIVTDPWSRHAAMIAEHVGMGKPYAMLQEEPEHCAESILVTARNLWLARLRIDELEAQLAMLGMLQPPSSASSPASTVLP